MDLKLSIPLLLAAVVLAADGIFCAVYKLRPVCGIITALVILCCLPYLILISFQKKYHDKCFEETNLYIEQMLYSFRKHPSVLSALQDVEKVLPDGNLQKRIRQAVGVIQTGRSAGAERDALAVIEEEYGCERVSSMHELMLNAMSSGGNCSESVRIMLDSKNEWRKTVDEHRDNCRRQMNNTTIAVIAVTLLGYISVYLIHSCLPEVSLLEIPVYQVATTAMVIFNFIIFVLAERKTNINWLVRKKTEDDGVIERSYRRYVTYDEKKEQKKAWLMSLLALPVILLSAYAGLTAGVVFGIAYFIYMLNIHKINHRAAAKKLRREIEKAYPRWLTEMALLLQTDNVYNAIRKTRESAAPVLQPALQQLQEELEKNPESPEPYFHFLSDFELPDVHASMTMLYSLASGNGGDTEKQIAEIVERNNAMSARAERMANEDELGKMYLTFIAPTMVGMAKLLVDMVLFIILFFTNIKL